MVVFINIKKMRDLTLDFKVKIEVKPICKCKTKKSWPFHGLPVPCATRIPRLWGCGLFLLLQAYFER